MVLELIVMTLIGEIILIHGIATWYRYSDMINDLKGADK